MVGKVDSTKAQNIRTNHNQSIVHTAMQRMIDQTNTLKNAHPSKNRIELQRILDNLPKRTLTRKETREQTISWIRGQLPRTMEQPTREELEELVDRGY